MAGGQTVKTWMKGLWVLCLCSISGVAATADLLYVKGYVELLAEDGSVKKSGKPGDEIDYGESIRVGKDSRALVKSSDGMASVLGANSEMRIKEAGFFDHLRGAAYYVLSKIPSAAQSRGNNYGVNTTVATLGIRGTRFLVDLNGDEGQVALTEGLINVSANEGKSFSIESYPDDMTFQEFQAAQKDLFDSFQKDDFKAYQESQKKAFERFKQEFFIQPNQSVSFDGESVSYQSINEETAALISELESILKQVEDDMAENSQNE